MIYWLLVFFCRMNLSLNLTVIDIWKTIRNKLSPYKQQLRINNNFT